MSADNPMPDSDTGHVLPVSELTLDGLGAAADPTLAAQGSVEHLQPGLDANLAGITDAIAYDGHVALALDSSTLPGLDTTLDLLTTAHDLFDVPAMDFGDSGGHDASVT